MATLLGRKGLLMSKMRTPRARLGSGGGGWRLTRDNLARIACPALVFWSRQNPTMPWEVGEEASRIIPDARWYLMEDAGHWPQFEKPAEFNNVMGNFLREVSGHA